MIQLSNTRRRHETSRRLEPENRRTLLPSVSFVRRRTRRGLLDIASLELGWFTDDILPTDQLTRTIRISRRAGYFAPPIQW